MQFNLFGYNVSVVKLDSPFKRSLRWRRILARRIDRQIGKVVWPKIPRMKALREYFGYGEPDESGYRQFTLGLREAKELCELLWLDNGNGDVA
jgi:hypothetical protein